MNHDATALLVPVPAADPLVEPWRSLYDPAAGEGVPAHVTLLYPFVGLNGEDEGLFARIADIMADVEAFPFRVGRPERLADILILPLEPEAPFVALRERILASWPEIVPYRGRYGLRPRMHVTVAWSAGARPGGAEDLDAIAAELEPCLPLEAKAEELWLMERREAHWSRKAAFAFR